jgi:translation elongation factor EF-1alpha
MMPVTQTFEAELEILEMLDYKPIMCKGYTCMMHIHTFVDEMEIKLILRIVGSSDKGDKKT